jgi:hypothetical protein
MAEAELTVGKKRRVAKPLTDEIHSPFQHLYRLSDTRLTI